MAITKKASNGVKLNDIQLKQILDDLYALDTGLKSRKKELVEIIQQIAAAKPATGFDEAFASALRAEIMTKARELGGKKQKSFIINFNFMNNKFIYAAAGAAIMLVILVPAMLFFSRASTPFGPGKPPAGGSVAKRGAFEPTISRVAANFFGRLSGNTATAPVAKEDAATSGQGSAVSVAPVAGFGRGGGGGGGGMATTDAKIGVMPPYEFKTYRYVYKGGELQLPGETLDVLKRLKGASVSVNMSDLVSGLNFGLSDISSFSGLAVQNVSLVQKTDFGYMINVFPDEGSVSINQNWGYWPVDKCQGDAKCFEDLRVKESDIPSDQEIIAIADAFLTEHNIDKSLYGEPEVGANNNWRIMYAASIDKTNFYFPESLDVTYPLKVDGKYVYDDWSGIKQGLIASVNIKAKRVSNLYSLTTQNYQSSAYAMETDVKKILAYAEAGGWGGGPYGEGTKTEELELGDPVLGYLRYYSYLPGENAELLIPALYFPIKKLPDDPNFYRKGITVPLAKEILAERQPQAVPPSPAPEPLIEPKPLR